MTVHDPDLAAFAESVSRAFSPSSGGGLDERLDDLGWLEAVDAWGGAALLTVFQEQGRACATSASLGRAVLASLGGPADLPLLLPHNGGLRPAFREPTGIDVDALATHAVRATQRAVVVVALERGTHLVAVATDHLDLADVGGIDPHAQLVRVSGSAIEVIEDLGPVDWTAALAVGRLALAGELTGLAWGMLALAREHAVVRRQFGRPIAAFQAVRHRLADCLVDASGAEAATAAAAQFWAGDELSDHAAIAKAIAGNAALTVARHSQQVLGGIGFTDEHPFHRYFKRTMLLDSLLGSSRELTRTVGARTIATQRAPFTLPLVEA